MAKWKLVLSVLLGLVGVVVIATFGATSALTQEYRPDFMANWIQAVGSVAAIAGIVWTVERQARDSLNAISKEAEVAIAQKRRSAISIVDAAMDRAERIRATMTIPDVDKVRVELYKTYDRSILDGLVRALQGIPLHELGASKAIAELLLFTDQINFLAIAIQRFLDGPLRDPEIGSELERYLGGTPEDKRTGLELRRSMIEVYRTNALQHLNAMRSHYTEFSNSLCTVTPK
ncbi:hypothetical protein [Burkholderia multivorans]|uniref:hypothetical protein n=1 Tax=Burkholderia multivorans TaxID=87883 RepID=UPI001C2454D2|nr:hypothetical protein [Burkholderia multivorans]MBU9281996.1 hypothetical protein [Burkholderia multivorans]